MAGASGRELLFKSDSVAWKLRTECVVEMIVRRERVVLTMLKSCATISRASGGRMVTHFLYGTLENCVRMVFLLGRRSRCRANSVIICAQILQVQVQVRPLDLS